MPHNWTTFHSSFKFLFTLFCLTLPHSDFTASLPTQRTTRPSQYVNDTQQVIKAGKQRLQHIHQQQPHQLLLSLTGRQDEMIVQWVTFDAVQLPHVICLPADSLSSDNDTIPSSLIRIYATTSVFHDPAHDSSIIRYIHNAKLSGLKSQTRYVYRVGDFHLNSRWQSFTTLPEAESLNTVTLVVYGDLGVANSQSMQYLQREVASGQVDVIVHVGDFAYDLFSDHGRVGDIFMDELSRRQLSSHVPYMGCTGNHEGKYNYSHYIHRFRAYEAAATNSHSNTNLYYAWEYVSGGAAVKMISIDTEVYFNNPRDEVAPDLSYVRNAQHKWLIATLQTARQSNAYDWMIVYGHRPMYCSNDYIECETETLQLRRGSEEWNGLGLEELLNKYSVDLYLCGHEHNYERLFPVFNDTNVDLNHENHTYVNPLYTTHIITGSAGCDEYLGDFSQSHTADWSAVRSSAYGYGKLIVYNATHLYWQQVLDEGRQGIDEMWIIKDKSKNS